MKTVLIPLLLITITSAGCGPQSNADESARINALEKRIATLEADLATRKSQSMSPLASQTTQQQSPPPTSVPRPPSAAFTAVESDLEQEFDNQLGFERKYTGKLVRVTGNANRVSEKGILMIGGYGHPGFYSFSKDQIDQLAALKPPQYVTVEGIYRGKINNKNGPIFEECVVIPDHP
jgi:hypothetical protein